jgi:hypothetical protein
MPARHPFETLAQLREHSLGRGDWAIGRFPQACAVFTIREASDAARIEPACEPRREPGLPELARDFVMQDSAVRERYWTARYRITLFIH